MTKVFFSQAGSKESSEPRPLGEVLADYLQTSNEPQAVAFRDRYAAWNRNTDLCMDVKTFLCQDRITQLGKGYPGVLTRDEECHYTFVETFPSKHSSPKRNPHEFVGESITVTRRDDGSLRLNFKPLKMDEDFNVEAYAIAVANEIILGLKGPVKEKPGE